MRKFFVLLIGCLILGTVAAEAQIKNATIIDPIKPRKEKNQYEVGARFDKTIELSGVIMDGDFAVCMNFIGGKRFNNTFFVGGGIGINVNEYEQVGLNLFAQGRSYFTKSRCKPFLALSIGCDLQDEHFGPYVNPEFGVNFHATQKISTYLTIGWAHYGHYNAHGPQLKLGVTF